MSNLRARLCSCKRTHRVAHTAVPKATDESPRPSVERTAAPPADESLRPSVERTAAPPADEYPRPSVERTAAPPAAGGSIFIETEDCNDCNLLYGIHLEAVPSVNSDDVPPTMEIRPSAEPVLRWCDEERELSALAAVSGGTILCLVHRSRRTVICDIASGTNTPGPRLHRSKRRPIMLPVGDDGTTVLVMETCLRPGRCAFEALRRLPGGGWRADALPDPPVALVEGSSRFCSLANPCVSAYFAIGSRAWISLSDQMGTFSLDTESGTWRMEGAWELPLRNLGIFVPELGVVMGIPRVIFFEPNDPRCCQVCALDIVEAQPPVVRHVWEIPPERAEDIAPGECVSLARLGNGRFCISRSIIVPGVSSGNKGTSFMLVDVSRLSNGDLELVKHGNAYCHVWPWGHIGHSSFLQSA